MWAVYRTSDGGLVSVGSVVADPLPAGLEKVDVGNPPFGAWNTGTLSFDPYVAPKRVVSRLEFRRLFTQAEREDIDDFRNSGLTVAQKKTLASWLEDIKLADQIDLNDATLQQGLQWLEARGFLSAGRAQQIINA